MAKKDDAPTETPVATEPSGDGADAVAAKPKGRKKVMIAAGAAAALLLGGGGGAYMMLGGKSASAEAPEAKHEAPAAEEKAEEGGGHGGGKGESVPLDVPPILVNLRTPDGAPHFLKLHVMLVPGPKGNFDELKKQLPILMDAYQPFLRELRPEDLSGSASVYRIKEELMLRSTRAIGAGQVQDVLVQDLIQQ